MISMLNDNEAEAGDTQNDSGTEINKNKDAEEVEGFETQKE